MAPVTVANSGTLVRLKTFRSLATIGNANAMCAAAAISGSENTVSTWELMVLRISLAGHAHLFQDVEALVVLVPFRDLLVVHDQNRRQDEREAQEKPQEQTGPRKCR